jgi:hypothetical protein
MVHFVTKFIATASSISALIEVLTDFLTVSGLDPHTTDHLALVIDRLLTNAADPEGQVAAPTSFPLAMLVDHGRGG